METLVESLIDFRLATDEFIVDYSDRVIIFC